MFIANSILFGKHCLNFFQAHPFGFRHNEVTDNANNDTNCRIHVKHSMYSLEKNNHYSYQST